jgi:hypothetical protein
MCVRSREIDASTCVVFLFSIGGVKEKIEKRTASCLELLYLLYKQKLFFLLTNISLYLNAVNCQLAKN